MFYLDVMKYLITALTMLLFGCGEKQKVFEGRVLNSLTGKPVVGATVGLVETEYLAWIDFMGEHGTAGRCTTSTDPVGKFVMRTDMGCGTVLVAKADGFAALRSPGQNELAIARFVAKTGLPRLITELRLQPEAVLTGRVVDQDGVAQANLSVRLVHRFKLGFRGTDFADNPYTATDDRGEFRLRGIREGEYLLLLDLNRDRSKGMTVQKDSKGQLTGPKPGFHPGGVTSDRATRFEIKAGQKIEGGEFKVGRVPLYRVEGRVDEEFVRPDLILRRMDLGKDVSSYFGAVYGSANFMGKYVFENLPPGRYRLEPQLRSMYEGQLDLEVVDRDLRDVALPFKKRKSTFPFGR